MVTSHDREEDALDAALDRLGAGGGSPNGAAVPGIRAAARLHALDRADPIADPQRGFLDALKKELTMSATTRPASRPVRPARSAGAGPWPIRTAPARRLGGAASWVALAAILALLITGSYVGLNGSRGGPAGSSVPAAAVATPTVPNEVAGAVDIAECDVAARPDGTVATLVDETPSRTPLLPAYTTAKRQDGSSHAVPDLEDPRVRVDPAAVLGDLPAATAVQRAGVTATLRRLTACRHFFDPIELWTFPATPTGAEPVATWIRFDGKLFANFSDDYFRKEGFIFTGPGTPGPQVSVFWTPIGPLPWTVADARQTADGRVVATVVAPAGTPYLQRVVAVFSQHDGRWLIDEFAVVDSTNLGAYGGAYPQYLEVVLQDTEGPSTAIPIPSMDAFQADDPITVTVANLGGQEQRFTIDRLDVDLVVRAGHSVSFVMTAPAGRFVMESYVPDANRGTFDPGYLRLEGVLRVAGAGTPIAVG